MNESEFTSVDLARLKHLSNVDGNVNRLQAFHNYQSMVDVITDKRDFELLYQDVRRAKAAYPAVNVKKLFLSKWVSVSRDAKVPLSWNTSHNGDFFVDQNGNSYLDGAVLVTVVSAEYPRRMSALETNRLLGKK